MPDKPWYEYLSRDAVVREGIDPLYADPRHPDEEMDRVMAALKKLDPHNQAGLDIYHD